MDQSDLLCLRADLDDVQEIAETWLMEAASYDLTTRLVNADELLRLVRSVNAALQHLDS